MRKLVIILVFVAALLACTRAYNRNDTRRQNVNGCVNGRTKYNRCGDRCICRNGRLTECTRIRKEFTTMTSEERRRHVQIIKTASTDPRYKARYDQLITLHKTLFNGQPGIHTIEHFLPWHRWYVLQYENLLREVDCKFTVAYWDFVANAGNLFGTTSRDVWYSGDTGLGGNGVASEQLCVKDGPFRDEIWNLEPKAATTCLRRNFGLWKKPPGKVELEMLLRIPATSSCFQSFADNLNVVFHGNIHCFISGTMCTRANDAASAPEFFFLHGMVDKIWEDWQKRSQSHRTIYFNNIDENMPATGTQARNFLDNSKLPGNIRVEYRDIRNEKIVKIAKMLARLSIKVLEAIPRQKITPILKSTIKLFRVTKSALRRVEKMRAKMNQHAAISLVKAATAISKQLGFDQKTVADAARDAAVNGTAADFEMDEDSC